MQIIYLFIFLKFLLQCFSAMTLFYCAHWQSYVSGTLRLGKVDVTEAQCMIMVIHMISAIFGPEIWLAKVIYSIFNSSHSITTPIYYIL